MVKNLIKGIGGIYLAAVILTPWSSVEKEMINKPVQNVIKQEKNLENLSTGILRTTPNLAGIEHSLLKIEQLDYKTSDFYQDSDKVLLARMLLGEAENCSKQEKIAVAYTAINRVNDNQKWNGEKLKEVILKPYQYSCFNKNLNNKLKDPLNYNSKEFLGCLELAEEILAGEYKDPTEGATHYYNPKLVKEPEWTKKAEKIGKIENSRHVFYKEE